MKSFGFLFVILIIITLSSGCGKKLPAEPPYPTPTPCFFNTFRSGADITEFTGAAVNPDNTYFAAGLLKNESVSYYTPYLYLAKINANGALIWDRSYGEGYASAMCGSVDGGAVMCRSWDFCNTGQRGSSVEKMDSSGNTVWATAICVQYGELWLKSLRNTSDGGYVLSGFSSEFGEESMHMVKVDGAGNISWQKTYGYDYYDGAKDAVPINGGGYILAGHINFLAPPPIKASAIIIKTDSAGNCVWAKTYDLPDDAFVRAALQANDGGYVITGEITLGPPNYQDLFVIKTDSDGNTLWQRLFPGTENKEANAITQTPDNGYLIAARTNHVAMGINTDIYLIKLNENGDTDWEKSLGGSDFDLPAAIIPSGDGSYIIPGYTYSCSQYSRAFLLKINSGGIKIW